MGAAKNVTLEPLPCALGVAAFLHNVIIVHPRFCFEIGFSLCTIILNYVTQLGKKNYWRKSRSVRVFSKNCASNFFWCVGKGVATEKLKRQFTTKRKRRSRY